MGKMKSMGMITTMAITITRNKSCIFGQKIPQTKFSKALIKRYPQQHSMEIHVQNSTLNLNNSFSAVLLLWILASIPVQDENSCIECFAMTGRQSVLSFFRSKT
jgi:hypothetical protein